MFSGFHKTRLNGGVEESTRKSREVDERETIGEASTSPLDGQYRPNEDRSLYLYGNTPRSTLEPHASSIGDWNNTYNTQQQFQYGNPETMTSSNQPNPGPYYLSNPSPYARADIGSSRVTTGPQSFAARAESFPFQYYGIPDPLTGRNNVRSNGMVSQTGGELATRSSYTSGTGYGACDEYYPSTDLKTTKNLVKNELDVEDEEVTIPRTRKTAGGNLSEHTSRTASRSASRSAFQTSSTKISRQGVLGNAQHNPIEATSDDETVRHEQGRGEIMWVNGTMVWRELKYNETEEPWQPAVYHYQIRHDLIEAADAQGTYDFARDRGIADSDVTCFLFAQKTWGMERANRPEILFQWEKADHKDPTYIVPDWYHDGKIVLDPDNRPVRKFRNIPDVCSSLLEGGVMEAIKREDSRVTHQDFVARMLPQILTKTPKGPQKSQALYSKNAMAARMRRFREEAGCIVWGIRAGSDTIRGYMLGIIPARFIEENNTKGFRDLYPHEILGIRQQNEGKFAKRAGHRAIDDNVRKARSLKMKAKCERRKERFEQGLKPKKRETETKRKQIAIQNTGTEDEAEVSDFDAAPRASTPRRRERRADPSVIPRGSTKRKPCETDWNEDSFELGDDGDDEGPVLYDEGCSTLNATHHKRQVKRQKLSGITEPAFGPTFANGNIASLADLQDDNGQVSYNVDTCQFDPINALDTSGIGNSVFNAVSDPFEGNFCNGSGFTEEMLTFYAGLDGEPATSPAVGPSNVAFEHNSSKGSTFEEETFNFLDAEFGEEAIDSNTGPLNAASTHNEIVGSTFAEESSHFYDALSGEPAAPFNVDQSNAASASNDLVDFDRFLANYLALAPSGTNVSSIEWGSILDRFFQDNVEEEEVREDKNLPSEVFLPLYEGGDRNSPS